MQRNEDEIKELFKIHKQTEEYFQHERQRLDAEQAEKLEAVRSEDANNQAEQKIKLEKEMQILEKCMEDMKAVFRLNEEKLEFNKKVLNDRQKVNNLYSAQLKNRERKLKEAVRTVRTNFFTAQAAFQKQNFADTKIYKQHTKLFTAL